jgi:hypothetical protein
VVQVFVPPARLSRWVANFGSRHGATDLRVDRGYLAGHGADGSSFRAELPFDLSYAGAGAGDVEEFVAAAVPPASWGVLLVRKGGFAIARMEAGQMVERKIGQRHVQGRTKAGGQSQQRFARRRDNQAREAYAAAADHAARILRPGPVVLGGDRAAADAVLEDTRLDLTPCGPWLAVPDPRRTVLDAAILDAQSVIIDVHNA